MTIRALVVGGTSGIGYGMACRVAAELASTASSVVISGRTKPDNMPHANMEFHSLDASSMRQIKRYTDTFKASLVEQQQQDKLDMLIMTQGIMTTAGRTETLEGIDRKMALHYYGKQLLIRELLPVLSDDAKVIIVLDGKHGNLKRLNWDDLDLKTTFSLRNAQDHCLTMTDGMIQYFAQQQQQGAAAAAGGKRLFVHAFPGGVNTNLLREFPWVLRAGLSPFMGLVLVSPDACAEYLLTGTSRAVVQCGEQGQWWANLDSKGGIVESKPIWDDDQLDKVAEHTWSIVDAALKVEQ